MESTGDIFAFASHSKSRIENGGAEKAELRIEGRGVRASFLLRRLRLGGKREEGRGKREEGPAFGIFGAGGVFGDSFCKIEMRESGSGLCKRTGALGT